MKRQSPQESFPRERDRPRREKEMKGGRRGRLEENMKKKKREREENELQERNGEKK